MHIYSNITNYNIPRILPIKSFSSKNVSLTKTNFDSVSFGANINYEKAKNIYSALGKAKRIGILVHKDADADALSSGILLFNLLKIRNQFKDKDIHFIINQKIPKYLTNLPDLSIITQYKDLKNKFFDTVVVLDCDETRVDCRDIFDNASTKINIDHHRNRESNPLFSKNLRIIDPDSVSTTQVIYDNFLVPFDIWPKKTMTECIMTGIVTDSGNLKNIPNEEKFSKTMKRLGQYSKLPLSAWAKKINYKFSISKQRSDELEKFFQDTINFEKNINTHITPNNKKINYILINKELLSKYNIQDEEVDIKETLNHIVSMLRPKCDIAATIWERKNGDIRLSMRSNHYDILNIAEKFNGGGHKFAAGATVSGNLEEALKNILKTLDTECFLNNIQ